MSTTPLESGRIAYCYHSLTTSHGYDNCTDIIGMNGRISINSIPHSNRVQVLNASGIVQDVTPSWIDRYKEAFVTELTQFIDAVLDGIELPLRLTSAYTGLKIATDLQYSLKTGLRIEFDEKGDQILFLAWQQCWRRKEGT